MLGRGEVTESGRVALAIVEDLDEPEQIGEGTVAVLEQIPEEPTS